MFAHLTWEHIGEGIIIGVGISVLVGALRYLGRTQRRVRVEHHQLLRWVRAAGRKIGLPFPTNHDNDDGYED